MGRRIRWLGAVLVVCFALVLLQLVNVQVRQGKALADSPNNPRNAAQRYDNPRGKILAADGTLLAYSKRATSVCGGYKYQRVYPAATAQLFSGVVGYDSCYYGTSGVEYQYNNYLKKHTQPPQTLSQFLSGQNKVSTDNVTLTLQPSIQAAAQQALQANPNTNKDGAVVALDPRTGAVLAMASNPTFDPNALSSPDIPTEQAAGKTDFQAKDAEGLYPGYPVATFNAFAPGSTFKVVTTTSVYNLDPSLAGFTWPPGGGTAPCTLPGEIPDTTHQICNDASTPQAGTPCGGGIAQMLPESCDPGYAILGLSVGADNLYKQSTLFGWNSVPPLDLPHVSKSNFPTPDQFAPGSPGGGPPALANSAFGQQDVTATTLQDAMVAAGIADNGSVMTPHVMAEVRNGQGALVQSYKPSVYQTACTPQAAQQVNQLMQAVVTAPYGTAYGIFPPSENVAAKTGTAQTRDPTTGQPETHDWMIAFAPASHPVVAVAVMVPYQPVSAYGATVAGPMAQRVIQAALALQPHNTTTTTAPPPAAPTTVAPAPSVAPSTGSGGGTPSTTVPVTAPPPTAPPTTVAPPTTATTAPPPTSTSGAGGASGGASSGITVPGVGP